MSEHSAIVTDALWRKSISAIRSLGRAGYSVTALGDSWLTTGFYSRFTAHRLVGDTAAKSPSEFLHLLERAVEADTSGPRPVIFPMEDESCWSLLRNAERLANRAEWLLPSEEAFTIASDKGLTMRLAAEIGVPAPCTHFPESPKQLLELARSNADRQWVSKPVVSRGSAGILYGDQITASSVKETWTERGPLLLQERIPARGTAIGVSLLYDRGGRCRAVFCHRRLHQYPVSGGPSTSRVSVAPEELPDLVRDSQKLLEHLGWRGVAMVEWKQDPVSGRYLLLEVNPRFWGSLELAVRAGVDFPLLYARAARGAALPEELPAYRTGVVCRWMIPGEILRYLGEPSSVREPFSEFLHGCVRDSEEFARDDIQGSLACVVCPALLALNPRYWRYLRRAPSNA